MSRQCSYAFLFECTIGIYNTKYMFLFMYIHLENYNMDNSYKKQTFMHFNFGILPVLFSASLKVTSSSTTPWLLPFEFTEKTTILKVTSGSRLSRKKYGSVYDVMLKRGIAELEEYSSRRKC